MRYGADRQNHRKKRGDSVNRKAAMYRRPGTSKFAVFSIIIVVIMLVCVMAFDGAALLRKKNANDERIAQIQQEIDAEIQRSEDLKEYEKYTKTKKFAEETAKQKLGLVHEGELIFRAK
ncbi:MAG: septum formation initiator family protein [Lachnospiraceae bacterium]|nr:septum formation initiator family protein [Lachnospiraceae bacterium]